MIVQKEFSVSPMDKEISRVNRTKSEARLSYNRLSHWYDFLSGRSEKKYRQIGFHLLDPKKGENILEIGSGTGHCLVSIGNAVGETGWVAGIDLSDGMVQIAQKRIIQTHLVERISLCIADGAQLPFSSRGFDAVFMSFTLELFDSAEIQQVLRQCYKVLKPSGRIVNVSLSKSTDPNIPEQIYEWFHSRMPTVLDCRPIDAEAALRSVGFKIGEIVARRMWGLPLEVIFGSK